MTDFSETFLEGPCGGDGWLASWPWRWVCAVLGGSGPVRGASGYHVGVCSRRGLGFGVDGWGVTGAGPHPAVTIVHTCLGPRRP